MIVLFGSKISGCATSDSSSEVVFQDRQRLQKIESSLIGYYQGKLHCAGITTDVALDIIAIINQEQGKTKLKLLPVDGSMQQRIYNAGQQTDYWTFRQRKFPDSEVEQVFFINSSATLSDRLVLFGDFYLNQENIYGLVARGKSQRQIYGLKEYLSSYESQGCGYFNMNKISQAKYLSIKQKVFPTAGKGILDQ